jgi:nicotinamide phosphoribosyltransferase
MCGVDAAASSGAGHLLSFSGTDTIPAILFLEEFYGADVEKELVGTSIPATEHSVMCAGIGVGGELETYRRLLEDVYPSGFLSIVSDTMDLWAVMEDILPALHDTIMGRDGKLVIRPDSGDPADIICGTGRHLASSGMLPRPFLPEDYGVYELLWKQFGGTINEAGFKVLDPHVGAIYGDSITPARARDIVERLEAKGFDTTSQVLGIGSYTYQYQTRDTLGFALKSTYVEVDGKGIQIYKNPKTDSSGTKKSLKGRCVVSTSYDGDMCVVDGLDREAQEGLVAQGDDLMQTVFLNGQTFNIQTLAEIRKRVLA